MRHIRDPITGYCIICEKNNIRHFVAPDELEGDSTSVHGGAPDRPRSNARRHESGKKTIHVASSSNGSDPGNKSGKSTSLSRPSSSASLSSDDYRQGTTSRSTSKLIIIERQGSYSPSSARRSPNRSPSPTLKSQKGKRGTSPPKRGRYSSTDRESGCCGKSNNRCCKRSGNVSKSRVFDESTNYNVTLLI